MIVKGQIGCEVNTNNYMPTKNLNEIKTGIVLLSRTTGSLQMLHSVFVYTGSGTELANLGSSVKLQREGICQPTTLKPLF